MTELACLLKTAVIRKGVEPVVGLLLSAGLDSVTTGIACQAAGKRVHAYTYELEGYRSDEREKAEVLARYFGWPLWIVTVPTANIANDFKWLAIDARCRKKVQFEVTFPLKDVLPEIPETEIWAGFNADDHYGNTRELVFEHARLRVAGVMPSERKEHFDQYRHSVYEESDGPQSSHTWRFAREIGLNHGKRLLDPYLDFAIRDYFSAFDHDQLSPLEKPIVRAAFASQLAGLPSNAIAKGIRLQKGGKVDELFRTLLGDPDVNRFAPAYKTVSGLCQRWHREVSEHPTEFANELASLPTGPSAKIRQPNTADYRPYLMADVLHASAAKKFTVISTFAGGGGSSTGYRLAGGIVLAVNEFVPEAARTYNRNFPDCPIDPRDIREIASSESSASTFLALAGIEPGELDVLDGSPPCSEFSTAGRGIGDQDVLRHYSDVKQNNIASLPFDLVVLTMKIRPKVLICENVPAFASRGAEVFRRVLRTLRFEEDGSTRRYYAAHAVLSASDFGVPQKRQRLFIIGIRKDVGERIRIESDEAVLGLFPTPNQVGVSIRSAFAGLQQSDGDVWPWVRSAMASPLLSKLIPLLPKNPPKHTRLAHVFSGYVKHHSLTRCAPDKPAPTMVVSSQRPNGLTGVLHPNRDRKFTLPELKRLTGLPDDFVLTGNLSQATERVCRMVPPFLTKAIAETVFLKVLLPYTEKSK